MVNPTIEQAMDLLTAGYRSTEEVKILFGEDILISALDNLEKDFGYDHIPWYAKR